jgi:N-acetylglucosamine kinase-like BadF-type ATPase
MDRVATNSAERHGSKRKALFVGADVGGTWIRIAVWSERRVATTIVPADRDLRELASVLRAVWRRRRWNRRRVATLVVASRGLWTPAERRTLARHLRGFASRVHVISDAQAALLGALGERPGVLLLSGTGSIVV